MGKYDSKFHMGDQVKCWVTKFQGRVTTISFPLHGVIRYGVQPEVDKDGKIPDAIEIDGDTLELLASAPKPAVPPGDDHGIGVGDEIKDPISGFAGTVTAITLHLNGCVTVSVAGKATKKGEIPLRGFYAARVERTGKSAVKQPAPEERRTGGPMERVDRSFCR